MILVTGGSGYLGSHITRQLAVAGEDLRVMIRDRGRMEREGRLDSIEVEFVEADVTEPETLGAALRGVVSVIHTVAIAIEKGGQTYDTTNYGGTINVVDAARAAGVTRFVNISQLGANPSLPYRFLASKGRAQSYVAASGLEWTAFRPSVIWGPEDEFANTFAKLVPFSPLIFPIVGSERSEFQPVWVEDVATSVLAALNDPATIGQVFELGGPEVLTLEEVERRTLAAVGARRIMIRFPLPLLRLIVATMEVLLPAPPVTRSLLEMLAVPNVTKTNSLARFVAEPRPFTSANIANYVTQFRARDTLQQFLGRS